MGPTDVLVAQGDDPVAGGVRFAPNGIMVVPTTTTGPKAQVQRVASHSRESSTSSAASSSGASSCDDSEPAVFKETILLEARLQQTRLELEQSKAECGRLAQIRDDVEAEVRELTASLFQVKINGACARNLFLKK